MMRHVQIIDGRLLEAISDRARQAKRRRINHNFHISENEPSNRLLNAMEPDSYIRPHRHRDAYKDETIIVVRGKIGLVCFADDGEVMVKALLAPTDASSGVNIPHGVFHTLVALEPGTVFFETKAGPYTPLTEDEKSSWAPAEGESEAPNYLAELKQLFD